MKAALIAPLDKSSQSTAFDFSPKLRDFAHLVCFKARIEDPDEVMLSGIERALVEAIYALGPMRLSISQLALLRTMAAIDQQAH